MRLPLTIPCHLFNKSPFKAGLFFLLMCCCLASSIPLLAQAPTQQWEKLLSGNNNDDAYAIVQTSDDGYLVGGTSDSDISGNKTAPKKGVSDFWVVKLTPSGNKLWDKTFGGSASNGLQAIVAASDGGYLLGGYSNSDISGDKTQPSKGGTDFWLVKIDSSGNKLWDKTFGGSGEDALFSLARTKDGGFLLAGNSDSGISGDKTQPSKGGTDFWIIKIDSTGSKQWDKTFGGNTQDELLAAIVTADGGYMIGGSSDSGISGDKTEASRGEQDFWVIKLDSTGSKQWDKTFGGSNHPDYSRAVDRLRSIFQTEGGNYLLAGESNSEIGGDKTAPRKGTRYDSDFWVVKINSAGVKQWDKTYGGEYDEKLRAMVKSPFGGYVLAGESYSGISGDKTEEIVNGSGDPWLIKIDSAGVKQWDKTFGDNFIEIPNAITVNMKGEYALAGIRVDGMFTDYQIIKTNAESVVALDSIKINFQNAQTVPPAGYMRDYGQAFGLRSGANQGNAYSYGWKAWTSGSPVDLSIGGSLPGNGRRRSLPSNVLLSTFMHMQGNDVKNFRGTPVEGYWEISVANGNYQVTVSVGDGSVYNFTDPEYHSINIEGVNAINRFVPTGPQGSMSRFKSATIQVTVADGRLTIDADGGQNTKINYAVIRPLQSSPTLSPFQAALHSIQSLPVQTVRASPNPFSDTFTLKSEQLSGRLDITLLDALGNQVYHAIHSSQAGEVWLDVTSASLKAGMYLIRIQAEDGSTQVMRIVKK